MSNKNNSGHWQRKTLLGKNIVIKKKKKTTIMGGGDFCIEGNL